MWITSWNVLSTKLKYEPQSIGPKDSDWSNGWYQSGLFFPSVVFLNKRAQRIEPFLIDLILTWILYVASLILES